MSFTTQDNIKLSSVNSEEEKSTHNKRKGRHMQYNFYKEINELHNSISDMEKQFADNLILNPVENIPFSDSLKPSVSFMHGLYNTDTIRTPEQKFDSKLQFSGREQITEDIKTIYEMWAKLLGAEALSMRLLSGLHAHIVLFMGISEIGDKVLYLPEKAGGHTSGRAILERLGLDIMEIPYDSVNYRVDKERCLALIKSFNPDVIFVDRSEGLVYEDFTWLGQSCSCCKIFDASQYLTNIICNDYNNPFNMGFDLIISTLHKNFPGPQRALICSKSDNEIWRRLRSKISCYVSNMHFYTIYSAGFMLSHMDELNILSRNMLQNAILLEQELIKEGVPMISRSTSALEPPTHHCWIKPESRQKAFELYVTMERIGLLANYRLLPYDIGYGLRLGLSGATRSGLEMKDIPYLAHLISKAYKYDYTASLKAETVDFIHTIKKRSSYNG